MWRNSGIALLVMVDSQDSGIDQCIRSINAMLLHWKPAQDRDIQIRLRMFDLESFRFWLKCASFSLPSPMKWFGVAKQAIILHTNHGNTKLISLRCPSTCGHHNCSHTSRDNPARSALGFWAIRTLDFEALKARPQYRKNWLTRYRLLPFAWISRRLIL